MCPDMKINHFYFIEKNNFNIFYQLCIELTCARTFSFKFTEVSLLANFFKSSSPKETPHFLETSTASFGCELPVKILKLEQL